MTNGLLNRAVHFIRCYGQDQDKMDARFAISLVKELYQALDALNKENLRLKTELMYYEASKKVS